MAELDLKKSTYYDDLKFLGITASKDENKKAYLTIDQANQVKALRSHVSKTGKRDGFESGALTVSSNNELADIPEPNDIYVEQEDIYVKPEEPTVTFDFNQLMRTAQEVKLRELATPDLLIRGLANQMTEEDLSPDLKEKLAAVREAVNPKWTPAELASKILAQHRSQKAQAQAEE
ncbi:MAG: hypothetical protein QNJ55_25695 [Xenococcus sp. MO_188.B8]|nr:hypothetical protein [Xenococcus sp. MO_188.B8]